MAAVQASPGSSLSLFVDILYLDLGLIATILYSIRCSTMTRASTPFPLFPFSPLSMPYKFFLYLRRELCVSALIDVKGRVDF